MSISSVFGLILVISVIIVIFCIMNGVDVTSLMKTKRSNQGGRHRYYEKERTTPVNDFPYRGVRQQKRDREKGFTDTVPDCGVFIDQYDAQARYIVETFELPEIGLGKGVTISGAHKKYGDIHLKDNGVQEYISEDHLLICRDQEGLYIKDNTSKNGVYLPTGKGRARRLGPNESVSVTSFFPVYLSKKQLLVFRMQEDSFVDPGDLNRMQDEVDNTVGEDVYQRDIHARRPGVKFGR